MADDFSLDEIGFLLSPPHERSPNEMAPANGKLSKKRLLIGDLIANNDELVRRVKELEGQEQQLCSIKRTASEVTELYKQEKKQRIEFERRALEESGRCSDLEKQLDILKLNCEQLQEEAKLKSLPVDSKDIVIIFMQLALRIQEDSCSGGLTRAEYNMLRKLKDYCKSANISVPPSKSLMKKRAKILTATKATSTETLVTPTMPTMCSIGVQSERFVTTRDQSVQHKNTTTTRGTTTAALIETRTVGTCFPEPEPPLDAYQILEKMLGWNITPVSPLSDEPFVPEELPMISVGTNTDICDIHREIDYLPVLPAQLKRSDSRPPSRTMHDSVKDELTPPIDAATPDGYSHTMAKKLFNFIPHSQSVLDKMPPQDFEEIWQIVGQMLLVALQSRPANSISQTDFRDWFYSLYESHQTQNDAPCIDISNKETFMAPAGEELSPDDRNGSIETPPPEMGLELTPIRLTQFKEIEELNTTPKINEQNSCAQECKKKKKKKKKEKKKEKKQKKKKEQSIPTTPTETAVNFLTNLSDFHNSNCDNLDIQLNEEERELMQLASSTASNMLSSITSPVHKDFLSLSPVTDMSSSPIFDESLNVDKPQSMNAKPLGTRAAHIDFMALFGSDSDSADDQASANTKVVVDEVNADINSSNTEEEIPNGCDVRHKDTPPEPNSVINNSDLGCDSHHINKTNRLQRKRKLSSRNSSDTQSGTSEDGNIVTSDDHLHVDDTNNKRLGGFSESLSETRVEANPVTSDDHTHVDYTNNKRRRISYEFQSDAREENVVISDDYPHADDTSNRHKSLSESSEHSSVANDCQPYADDTNNIRGLSETRVEANNLYADYTNNTLSYEFQSDAREESEVTSDCYPHANDTSNRRKSLSESSEDSSVANDGQPYADDTNNIRGLSETRVEANNPYADYTNNTLSYESQSDAREENEVTSDGYPHADDTSNRRKSLCESSEETSVANDGQPYADDTSNRRKRSSYKSISESSEETSVSNDGDPQTDDIRNRLLSEPPPETRVEANSVTNDSHPNADYTNHTRGRISYESQPSAREEIVGTSDGHPHADDTSNRRKSLSESSEDSSVANDGQPYADDTNNIRGLSETRVEANNPYADYTNNTLSYEFQSDAREENVVTSDGHPHANKTSNRRKRSSYKSMSESGEENEVTSDGHPHANKTSNRRKRSSYKSMSESAEENEVTSDGYPHADDTSYRRKRSSYKSMSESGEENEVTSDGHPHANKTSNRRKRSSYKSMSESGEETAVTSVGRPHAEDTKLRSAGAKQPSQVAVTVPPVKCIRRASKRIALKKKSTSNEESVDSNQSVDKKSVFDDLENGTDRHDMDADKLAVIIPTEIKKLETSTIICETVASQLTINDESDHDADSGERGLIINEDIQPDNEYINETLPSVLIDQYMNEMSEDPSESDVDTMDQNPVSNGGHHSDSGHDDDNTCLQDNIESPTVICSSFSSLSELNGSDALVAPEHSDEDKQQNRKPPGKPKQHCSMNDSFESQCTSKRLTRLQAKQLQLDADDQESSSGIAVQESCLYESSPMSPTLPDSCEAIGSEPIEIPLNLPGGKRSLGAPKPLISYMINAYKAEPKKHQTNKPKRRVDMLNSQLREYLKQSDELEPTSIQYKGIDDQYIIIALIAAYSEASDETVNNTIVMQRTLTLIKQLQCEKNSFIGHFMKILEQRLFKAKDRLTDPAAFMCVKLYLQLIGLQAMQANPVESYENPARLFLAKILYHYSKQMSLLVMEVLCHYPTVLPHREEQSYDHSDPLITVIKHLLMCNTYNVSDPNGPDRALISKLRYEYHFQPFKPKKQDVIENLIEKIKAGRTHELSYAFALFCRRSIQLNVTNMLMKQLIALVTNYCDLCVQTEEYDARMECLLQCTSMIAKQQHLDSNVDLTTYLTLFKRIIVAVPRPGVQEAAVQAILRMQRFGYEFVVDALQGYKPTYPLSPMTRAMLRSFVERRYLYLLAAKA